MAKIKTKFICSECGYETGKWLGRCPSCSSYNTFNEEITESRSAINIRSVKPSKMPKTLSNISMQQEQRTPTRISELDRVLGGGIVQGSLILVGGDPGIGKSTILLQISQALGDTGKKILYISGEESEKQIKMRASRLDVTTENLLLLSETNINSIEAVILEVMPDIVIIDSIQTMFVDEAASAPGSVTQVRECTSRIMRVGKSNDISVIVVGHVTKDGSLAGPKILEHIVDTVLYFEGDKTANYRLLRAVKNRFGSTNEIGVFEMRDKGLKEILNPSEYMLSGRPVGVSGSAVTCSIEGTRPLLAEVQALVSYSAFGKPQIMATGMDYKRAAMLMAVLEKRAGVQLSSYDCYINLAGGLRIAETSLDAAVACAAASSCKNKPIDQNTLIFGEIGLTGEVRAVSSADKRISEGAKLGFKTFIVPRECMKQLESFDNLKNLNIIGVSNVIELLDKAL